MVKTKDPRVGIDPNARGLAGRESNSNKNPAKPNTIKESPKIKTSVTDSSKSSDSESGTEQFNVHFLIFFYNISIKFSSIY